MTRSINRLFTSRAALAMLLLALGALAGCAGNPAALADIRYDLGPPPLPASTGTMPAIKVLEVTAPPTLGSDKLIYRLSYADSQQTASYATSHWTMPPAQLVTQRLRNALSSRGTVLTGGDGVSAPVLKVDLDEFEQDFDGRSESHGSVTARTTLFVDGKVVGQRTFIARAPASSADAAGARARSPPPPTISSRRFPRGLACRRSSRSNDGSPRRSGSTGWLTSRGSAVRRRLRGRRWCCMRH